MESLYLPRNGCGGWMRVILAFVVAAGVSIGIAHGDDAAGGAYEIQILSGRPDMVSGGNALVGITATLDSYPSGLRVSLDGKDVTSAFRPSSPGVLVGLVEGLSGTGELACERRRHAAGHAVAGEPSDQRAGVLRTPRAPIRVRNRRVRAGLGRDAGRTA